MWRNFDILKICWRVTSFEMAVVCFSRNGSWLLQWQSLQDETTVTPFHCFIRWLRVSFAKFVRNDYFCKYEKNKIKKLIARRHQAQAAPQLAGRTGELVAAGTWLVDAGSSRPRAQLLAQQHFVWVETQAEAGLAASIAGHQGGQPGHASSRKQCLDIYSAVSFYSRLISV